MSDAAPQQAPAPVSCHALRTHVERLAGQIGERNVWRPTALAAARNYIRAALASQGHRVTLEEYTAREVLCANLVIDLEGTNRRKEILLVGAHYDTVPGSPGADDNASGVAALLELGRRLGGHGAARTIRLVAFVNEEPPFFSEGSMGSRVHAEGAKRRGEDIRGMFSLEMLGCYKDEPGSQRYPPLFRHFYPDTGNFIAFVTNFRSRRLLRRAVAAFRAGSDFPLECTATFGWIPGVSWSDHLSFWREGYPALMVTDTAFFRYEHYHSPLDTPEKLDYARMARVTEGLAGMLLGLADDDR